jgi:hypothetical protein
MKQDQSLTGLRKITIFLIIVSLSILASGQALAARLGDSGKSVTDIQKRLRDLGYFRDSITGYFGEQTENAVRNFQRDCGIRVDGIVESNTSHYLFTIPSDCPNDNSGGGSTTYRYCQNAPFGYVVAVPISHSGVVSRVFNLFAESCIQRDNQGDFVNAGEFSNYNHAQMRALSLRQSGLDARVVHK